MSGNRRSRRKAFLVSAVVVGGAMLMSACQDTDEPTDKGTAASDSQGSASATPAGGAGTSSGSSSGSSSGKDGGKSGGEGSGAAGKGTDDGGGSGVDTGNGQREAVAQVCGANDISWSTKSETQGGGYILVIAKAKAGITCYLPAALPTVAFGSDGTQAGPAEQAVGEQIKLSGGTTAYAGVNPKTTKEDGGKELDSIIVGVDDNDPNPVSLPVGTITVEDPIVTNWHTVATDAVPLG